MHEYLLLAVEAGHKGTWEFFLGPQLVFPYGTPHRWSEAIVTIICYLNAVKTEKPHMTTYSAASI